MTPVRGREEGGEHKEPFIPEDTPLVPQHATRVSNCSTPRRDETSSAHHVLDTKIGRCDSDLAFSLTGPVGESQTAVFWCQTMTTPPRCAPDSSPSSCDLEAQPNSPSPLVECASNNSHLGGGAGVSWGIWNQTLLIVLCRHSGSFLLLLLEKKKSLSRVGRVKPSVHAGPMPLPEPRIPP